MFRHSSVVAATLLLLLFAPAAHAMVGDTTIGALADRADRILTGEVVRIVEVPWSMVRRDGPCCSTMARVAEVRPVSWIKGESRPERVFLLAEGTWTCDTSSAEPGETALFFLQFNERDPFGEPAYLGARFEALCGALTVDRIAWSGCGRMPLRRLLGQDHVTIDVDIVRVPPEIETYPGENPRLDDIVRSVRLDELLTWLQRRFSPRPPSSDPKTARIEGLAATLAREEESQEADAAVHELAKLGGPALPVLLSLLRNPAPSLRDGAALALARLEEAGFAALLAGLASKDAAERRAVADALCFAWLFLPEDAATALREAAADPDPEVRWRVLWSLAMRQAGQSRSWLADALEAGDRDLAWHAAEALSCFGFELLFFDDDGEAEAFRARAEKALLAMTEDASVKLRRAAFRALALRCGDAALPAVARALGGEDPVVRINAIHCLGRMLTDASMRLAVALLESADPWMRRAAANALHEPSSPRADGNAPGDARTTGGVDALARALADPDRLVRMNAVHALGSIGPAASAALPALEAALEKARGTYDRYGIEKALTSIRR